MPHSKVEAGGGGTVAICKGPWVHYRGMGSPLCGKFASGGVLPPPESTLCFRASDPVLPGQHFDHYTVFTCLLYECFLKKLEALLEFSISG